MKILDNATPRKSEYDYSAVVIVTVCTLFALITVLLLGSMSFDQVVVGRRDFVTYWAAGQQLVHHASPYDAPALERLELGAGLNTPGMPYYVRNVPWALPLTVPLGYLSSRAAALPWSLGMLALLIISVNINWKMIETVDIEKIMKEKQHLKWLGYCFPPALFCIILGQTSILLLFGLVLFLRLHRTHPFAAGAALWFCTLKPHLFLPFGVVLLAWIFVSRSYRVLAGVVTALAAGAALTQWIAPGAFGQYEHYARTSVMTHEFTACLGDVLRDSINPGAEWLAFIPAALGCLWGLAYYWRRRENWDWLENGSLLVLVSLFVAPFGWIFDQSLAISAVLLGASRTKSRAVLTVMAAMCLAIGIEVDGVPLHSRAYLWAAPAWILWYWMALKSARQPAPAVAQV